MQVSKDTITPKKAMEWLKRNVANRPLSAAAITTYARAMESGVWRLNGDCIRFNGNGDLIDGQHRLTACVQAATPFDSYVARGLDHEAFDTIDQGRRRTIGDVFARQGHKHYITLASAVRWMWLYEASETPVTGGKKGGIRSDEANAILEKHPGLHAAVETARHLTQRQKLIHPGLLSFLIYYTSQRDEQKALEFWSAVVDATGLKKDSPAYVLHKRLVSNLGSVAKLNVETVAALSIKAWNAHRTNKPCGTLKWAGDEAFPKIHL